MAQIEKLNSAIIREIYTTCVKNNIPLVFVLYHWQGPHAKWVGDLAISTFTKQNVEFININSLVKQYILSCPFKGSDTMTRSHYNDLGNKIVGEILVRELGLAKELPPRGQNRTMASNSPAGIKCNL